jgi:hypothetical protein
MARLPVSLFVLLGAVACGSSQSQVQAPVQGPQAMAPAGAEVPEPPQPGQAGVTCRWEQPTGSFIRKQVCRRNDEMEQMAKTAQEVWNKPRLRPDAQD